MNDDFNILKYHMLFFSCVTMVKLKTKLPENIRCAIISKNKTCNEYKAISKDLSSILFQLTCNFKEETEQITWTIIITLLFNYWLYPLAVMTDFKRLLSLELPRTSLDVGVRGKLMR